MAKIKLDTSNPGKVADVLARASILFARVSGYITENKRRESLGEAMAYDSDSFEEAIAECFPEPPSHRGADNGNQDTDMVLEELCKEVHERYEASAKRVGWKSQCPVPWDDVPETNKRVMRSALRPVADRLASWTRT
jgi:hypothetical protein